MRNTPALAALLAASAPAFAAESNPAVTRPTADYVVDVPALAKPASSQLRELIERFRVDRAELERFYSLRGSAQRAQRMREFFEVWKTRLAAVNFDALDVDGRIDATLLRTRLNHELRLLERDAERTAEMNDVLPFAADLFRLEESRRLLEPVDARASATALDAARKKVETTKAALEAGLKPKADKPEPAARSDAPAKPITAPLKISNVVALRAVRRLADVEDALKTWFDTFNGYDPIFGWWNREPYRQLAEAFSDYKKFLREKCAGIDPKAKEEPVIGDPIGRAGLLAELENEMVAYTPEELIAIAEREFKWVEQERIRAAREMGFGEDWKAALEKVKMAHVEPGQQPALVRELALEATRYVQERDLVTVPPLAADVWLLRMLSRDRQKEAPFFLGGSDIHVAFPTDAMTVEEKEQSLRSNNRHFSRATVFHELVPGHHLQFYAMVRYNPHRGLFTTPFWMEGWALWWEFRLWDLKFTATPEDRTGALFWRAHRCARIIFSLKFHLGEWTPQQCIDFIVDRVGFERASATAEVRRSFNGLWSPLYQAGYMLGAMQIRSLFQQLVATGRMPEKQFHDTILRGGTMPIEMVRAYLTREKLPRDFKPTWRFGE